MEKRNYLKSFCALALCFGLIFALTGCKKASPEAIEKKISEDLKNAQYFDADIKGSLKADIAQLSGQNVTIEMNMKMDKSGGFPIMIMDGTVGVEGLLTMPATIYFDSEKMVVSAMGQSMQNPIPEKIKKQLDESLAKGNAQQELNKTVTATKVGDSSALEIAYDLEQINKHFAEKNGGKTDVKLEEMKMFYILKGKDELDGISVDMTIVSGANGEKMQMQFEIKYNSIGQPVTITAPAVN
ncbi:MAG: hypothetical protein IJR47_02690 [Clostridia bacterium]|nr:hypothetical protein [Clostridia bacterium]